MINFITGNSKKLDEIINILDMDLDDIDEPYDNTNNNNNTNTNNLKFQLKPYKLDLPELQGEPEYIATVKCRFAAEYIDEPVLIEDTSLCFNALGGLPGPYIKWFLDKTGLDGLNKLLIGYEDKTAYAQTIFAYTEGANKPVKLFIGKLNGTIVPARGTLGFGWDPIFQPDNEYDNQTFGEMEQYKKNLMSHRYLALQKVKEYFSKI